MIELIRDISAAFEALAWWSVASIAAIATHFVMLKISQTRVNNDTKEQS